MKTFILVGEQAVSRFNNQDWEQFEEIILEDFDGDIIAWDKEADSTSTLLNMLSGWDNFIELSQQDLKDIEANTKIEIEW